VRQAGISAGLRIEWRLALRTRDAGRQLGRLFLRPAAGGDNGPRPLRKPPGLVAQIFWRPCQPYNQEPFNRRANGARRRDQQHTGRIAICDEILEVNPHRPDVPRNENRPGVRGNLENRGIGSAAWNYAGRASEIDGRLPAPQASPDVRIKVRVSLKGNLQASLADLSFLTRLKRSTMSAGMG